MHPGVGAAGRRGLRRGGHCQFGMVPRGPDGRPMPAKKPTRFLSSAPAVLEALGQRCDGRRRCQVLEGSGRAAAAARYPAGLCRAILRSAERQRRRGGDHAPAGVRQLQACDLGAFELRRADGGVAGQVLEVDANVLESEIGGEEEGQATYGNPAGGQWVACRRPPAARFPQAMSPTLDEDTGDVLPAKLVAAAKEEEVAAMEGVWDVWGVAPVAEAWQATGRRPIGGRWV